jgi:hypothetical protein
MSVNPLPGISTIVMNMSTTCYTRLCDIMASTQLPTRKDSHCLKRREEVLTSSSVTMGSQLLSTSPSRSQRKQGRLLNEWTHDTQRKSATTRPTEPLHHIASFHSSWTYMHSSHRVLYKTSVSCTRRHSTTHCFAMTSSPTCRWNSSGASATVYSSNTWTPTSIPRKSGIGRMQTHRLNSSFFLFSFLESCFCFLFFKFLFLSCFFISSLPLVYKSKNLKGRLFMSS